MLERWAGHGRRRHRGRAGRPPRRLPGVPARHRVAVRAAARASRPPTARTPWTAGTLFPRSSKKAARAINAASGNRPLVVLANLSGFDGSPESMRNLQLEYGAEIGRAIVNFDGPDRVLRRSPATTAARSWCSPRRSTRNMTVLAVEGSFASVIGGAPGRGRGVRRRRQRADRAATRGSASWRRGSAEAGGAERAELGAELAELRAAVRAEKLGEVAAEFDARAQHPARRRGRLGRRDHRRQRAATPPGRWHRGRALESSTGRVPWSHAPSVQIVDEDGSDHGKWCGPSFVVPRTADRIHEREADREHQRTEQRATPCGGHRVRVRRALRHPGAEERRRRHHPGGQDDPAPLPAAALPGRHGHPVRG